MNFVPIVLILVSVVITVRRKKYTLALGNVIEDLERERGAMEQILREAFDVDDIAGAIANLERAKAGLLAAILYFTKHLDG